MTVIAVTLAMPHLGKRQTTEDKARKLGDIYARHGASVKVANVVSGPNAGGIALIRGYEDFRAASKAFLAIGADPEHAEFWKQRESDPSADIVIALDIVRSVYGEGKWDTHPVSLIRQYDLARDKVEDAIKILDEGAKIMAEADVNLVVLLLFSSDNMSSFSASYQFRFVEHLGEAVDTAGASEAFQAVIAKAAGLGTIRSAFMMVPL